MDMLKKKNAAEEDQLKEKFRKDLHGYLDDVTSESARQTVRADCSDFISRFGWSEEKTDLFYEQAYNEEYDMRIVKAMQKDGSPRHIAVIGKEAVLQ